ncbi:MAG: substrate-binding domain-containing protein [Rectinemataceae bacterium]|nr:substrate-binding domain-containing protein [Rectinemataceae bacterium]
MKRIPHAVLAVVFCLLAVFIASAQVPGTPAQARLRLATTTSTEQSGLLASILPVFEKETGYRVEVVAVGTGASLKIGEKGDCDVVLVHARALEDAFMAAGFGADRKDVMYNDFIVLGPVPDPAGIARLKTTVEVFNAVARTRSPFVSRGDNSGTDVKEKDVWKLAGLKPSAAKGDSWYREAGQGMSQVIIMADGMSAYTLADRGTWLAMKDKSALRILHQGDKDLFNPYGIITVSPVKWPKSNYAGAKALMDWMTGSEGKKLISAYRIGGEQCFYAY